MGKAGAADQAAPAVSTDSAVSAETATNAATARRVVVVGASGFVGTQVCEALEARGVEVTRSHAPRLAPMSIAEAWQFVERATLDEALIDAWRGADAIINAAGEPDASSRDSAALIASNGALPGVLGRMAREAGIKRFVQVSSAVVQGRRPTLDASESFDAFSPYAKSKFAGERFAARFGPEETIRYRPPSVHHESRRVTRATAKIARSALSSVASPGTGPTPQALAANVGAALAELALTAKTPPAVVTHPWEGQTCEGLLRTLGNREPKRVPRWIARAAVRAANALGKLAPSVAANARRIEMVWFGQAQAESWLTQQGWQPPVGEEGWRALGEKLE